MSALAIPRLLLDHPIAGRQPMRSLGRYAWWHCWQRITSRPRTVPFVGSTRIRLTGRSTSASFGYYTGLPEFADMALLLHTLGPGDLFADVGANVGLYSLLATTVGARAVSFEPIPATYQMLVDHVELNSLAKQITTHNVGVGQQWQSLWFTAERDELNRVVKVADGAQAPADCIRVPVEPLDTLLAGAVPALMKIDVEGFEAAVLRGAGKTLAHPGLQVVIIELQGRGTDYGHDRDEPVQRLRDAGLVLCTYDPWSRTLTPADQITHGNNVFVRDLDQTRQRVTNAQPVTIRGISV